VSGVTYAPDGLTGCSVQAAPATDTDPVAAATGGTRNRVRPIGLSPGGATFIGAWVVGLAIARLTGAAAVILLLAGGIVGFGCAAISGWLSVRRISVRSIVGPSSTTAGTSTDLTISLKTPEKQSGDVRLAISTTRGFETLSAATVLPRGSGRARHSRVAETDAGIDIRVPARFQQAGVVDQLHARAESAGVAGLIWWRRTTKLGTEPIHVAPVASGPLLPIDQGSSRRDGPSSNRSGSHSGEIDGVRPWREGDSGEAIHWPSTLRAGDLIVHDRVSATDTTWHVPFDVGDSPAQLRWTLDEGLRHGHDVTLDIAGDEPVPIRSTDDAASWSAQLARRNASSSTALGQTIPLLKRPITWPKSSEIETSIGLRARSFTAVAAFLALAMLLGALSASAVMTLVAALGVLIGAVVSYYFARSGRGRPILLRIGIALAALAALVVIAIDANGINGLLAALRGPMPDLLMLLVVLHGFEVTDRRTLRVHQAITFVVAAYAAGLRIDGALGWWLAAWALAFVGAVLSTTRPPKPAATSDDANVDSHSPITGTVDRVPNSRQAARATVWLVGAAAVTLALLSIVPIPDGPARLGLPALSNNASTVNSPGALAGPDGSLSQDGTGGGTRGSLSQAGGYLGFAETLDTSVRGDLGDEIVMRVRSPEPAFWRGQTFTDFDGRSWTVSPESGVPRTGPTINVPPTLGDITASNVESKDLVQTYFIEADLPNVVFAAYRPEQLVFDGTVWTRPDGALRSDVTLTKGSVYTVVSDRLQVTPEILRAQGDISDIFDEFREVDSANVLEPFLAIPDTTTARTIELAEQLRTPGESTYDTIQAYQAWLSTNTVYDLNAPVPAQGADAVDDYLFESRRGFCEQIASTLAVMLRSQGMPTRLATGYISGERDRVSGVWKVRASDAHSWVEVWFPQTGWEAFDPTASVPLAGDAGNGTVGGDLLGAALTSATSHPIEIGLAALLAMISWSAVRVLRILQQRRRRGRWGLLQDRFSALSPTSATNPEVANDLIQRLDEGIDPPAVAEELDRAAFDPTWIDNDESFETVSGRVATLERRAE
jgi:transglutaminase-like putative cysteine protease